MACATITSDKLIEKFKYALDNKWGYIWGTAGILWTQARQNATKDEQAKKYGWKWIGRYVADCSGLFSWAFKQLNSYMYHGSNTMWREYCTANGTLKAGKRTDGQELKPGTAVFTDHYGDKTHVGLYIGDGLVIEASGTKTGVVTSKVTNTKWKCWGELKYVDYGPYDKMGGEFSEVVDRTISGEASPVVTKPTKIAKQPVYPTVRRGDKGELVTQLQDLLSRDGSSLAVDGIFGPGTQSAVRAFQKKHDLVVDGIVGPKTWGELLKIK